MIRGRHRYGDRIDAGIEITMIREGGDTVPGSDVPRTSGVAVDYGDKAGPGERRKDAGVMLSQAADADDCNPHRPWR